ncbi:hypothetical protein [Paraurantiacibacter namhicola]|uniref:DUF4345 domain-containing protein n=1 Tax=Paraurantiacibacter namhicola TaxID=645517 RepID=A0A1C7DBL2_9SPHN|nr:hypothetical protein [Paraurantiacibacter namhicola]ANU08835.1 hypothetical protein A6F65_02557 [Paraurantiacibacter namhicola]
MRLLLIAALFLLGIVFVANGIGFLLTPEQQAAGFGMGADGIQGLSTLRADMTAFFVVAGGALMWGAWRRAGDVLLVAAALVGIAFTGRFVSLLADGIYEGWWFPMGVEALTVVLALIGSRMLPHHAMKA